MPTNFLSPEQISRYARFNSDPSPEDLAEFFHLKDTDQPLLDTCRLNHTKLGMAIQICTLRYLNAFLADPTAVPAIVSKTLADQLGIGDPSVLKKYLERRTTKFEHAEQIREHLGFKTFNGWEIMHLMRFLYSRMLVSDERPTVLFDQATRRLTERRVILPGARVLERLVVRVRDHVTKRLYRTLSKRLTGKQSAHLDDLLIVPDGERRTALERLRTPPTRTSSPALVAALERIESIRELGVSNVDLSDLPQSRLLALSQYAMVAWAQHLAKLNLERRRATLLAFAQHLERNATDDALDVFDSLMHSLGLKGERQRRKERLRTLKDLDQFALVLRDAARLVLDSSIKDDQLRATVFARIGEANLLEAIGQVSELASATSDLEAEVWSNASGVVGKFIIKLLTTITFEGTPSVKALLDAMKFVTRTTGKSKSTWGEIPRAFVPKRWESQVFPKGEINRAAYVVCVAHQLQQALKRREIFVTRSNTHGDPRAQLLQGEVWEHLRMETCRSLGLPLKADVEIEQLSSQLDAAYQSVLKQIEHDPSIVLEEVDGVLTPKVAALEALPESESFKALDGRAESRLPDIDFSELLLEVNAYAGFMGEMTLSSEGQPRGADLTTSMCAVLVAQACNIGLRAVARPNHPALNIGRLLWVQQNYIRADTIMRANAKLVEQHSGLPIVQQWGGGEVASADGLRFVVPVRSIFTGSNSRYFGAQRGITYYTLTSDQFTMLHGIVVPGTLRDSLYILSTLLEQQTHLKPVEIMSDTAGYSDVVFGLFKLLGYQFSPRLADVGGSRYWRIDRNAKYGKLEGISKNRINTALISQHWDDILRVVGSLKRNTVKAPDVMRVLARDGSLSGLGKAIAEIGRVAKTMYLLEYVSNEAYRRRIHTQLNRGESRGRLARAVMHGNKGEIREKYRAGMEDQLGALGLVVNAIALWNARYLQAALSVIEAMGDSVLEEDVARLSPLKFAHINMLGRYHFELAADAAGGDLRALRDPNALSVFEVPRTV